MSEAPAELAERALAHAAPLGDGAQATVTRERSLLSRFARSRPTQATAVDDLTVDVLSVAGGHVGTASTNDVTDDGLRAAARRAAVAARAAREAAGGADGPYPGLPAPATPRAHDGLDLRTATLADGGAEAAGRALGDAFAVCGDAGLEAFGVWTAGRVTTAIASTTGVRAADDVTDAYLKVIARDPATARSGWGAAAGTGVDALDAARVARDAVALVAREEPAAVGPGEYPVVLAWDAAGALLDMLGSIAFNGLAYAEGRSALCGRLGTRVAASAINLSDSPRFARTLPRAVDAEGVPKAPLPLIQDGVAHRVVHDTSSAALAGGGATTTGHALAPGGSPYGPAPANLVLVGGGAASLDELCAPIERGLLVTRLWYLNPVHERSVLLTGTTRDGTFWIEEGRVARPARDVRFTDSPLRILEATEALTAEQRLVCEADFYGRRFAHGVVCPALRAHGFRVTGESTR